MVLVCDLKYEFSCSAYHLLINLLTCQFKISFLELNTTRSKNVSVWRERISHTPKPISIRSQEVDIVKKIKSLVNFLDECLPFCDHVEENNVFSY